MILIKLLNKLPNFNYKLKKKKRKNNQMKNNFKPNK